MQLREAELLRDKQHLFATMQQYQDYIDGLHMEKGEMIHEKNELARVHTLETTELLEQNNILTDAVHKLRRHSMMVVDTDELEIGSDGDDVAFGFDGLTTTTTTTTNTATATAAEKLPLQQQKSSNHHHHHHPFSLNAFYMCLLFGAFIASNATSSARPLPHLSEEYRCESANIVKAVLSDDVTRSIAAPAAVPASGNTIELHNNNNNNMEESLSTTLDQLHNALTIPTKEQEQEQAFTMTPGQYNSLTTFDHASVTTDIEHAEPGLSNLQQALNAMWSDRKASSSASSSSEVSSRSFMWDQVPEKVIHDFRRMVQEYGHRDRGQIKQKPGLKQEKESF